MDEITPMTEAEARADIALFTEASNAPVLTEADLDVLVRKAKRMDYLHRQPSHSEWVPTWNIAHAIALGWQVKSGRLAGVTSFSLRGQSFTSREKFYDHCMEQMKIWKSRASESIQVKGSYRRFWPYPGQSGTLWGDQTNGYLEDDYVP